jgi:hypothetical protein
MEVVGMADRSRQTGALIAVGVALAGALLGSLVFALVPSVSEGNAGRIAAGLLGGASVLLAGLLIALVRARG